MFWADRIAEDICKRYAKKIDAGETLIIRDEKTASGRVHVGSMRGVAIHGLVYEALKKRDVSVRFLFEINDYDPMDDIPGYLDEATYKPYLMRPLYTIPSPEPGAANFAEFYGSEFMEVIEETGFHPEFYRASELYKRGDMNEYVVAALNNKDKIRDIYKRVSGSDKPDTWYPVSIVEKVCDGIPVVTDWDGEVVSWECKETNETGTLDPRNGVVKLQWKVDWAAKFGALSVDIEGAGKDHSTKGGSRDVSSHIAREVFGIQPPYDIPYEFFLIGGKKMSSSKGRGSSARVVANMLPHHIFRLALSAREPKRQIDFDPDGDTIPLLFDEYDRLAEKYWGDADDDQARLFEYIHTDETEQLLEQRYLPRFSLIAFLVQMPHMDIAAEVARMKEAELSSADIQELELRVTYSKKWLAEHAPEQYKYELQEDTVPEEAHTFDAEQKAALQKLAVAVEAMTTLDGQELHTTLHDIKKETKIEPKKLFSAIYLAFLGRTSGPKAGWFLSVLPRTFLLERLREVAA